MNLTEVKILYNTDHQWFSDQVLTTKEHITELIHWVSNRPDVIHVSKTIILPDGEHNDKRQEGR